MKSLATALSLLVIAASVFFLIGYAAGDRRFYTLPNETFTAVALPSALLFLLLGVISTILCVPPTRRQCHHRLLLVDDDPNDRILFRLAADRYFIVDEASTLSEAIEAAAHRAYYCVVLDLKLPDSDRLSTIKTFLKSSTSACCIAFSGASEQAAESKAQGASAFIHKSHKYDPEELRDLIFRARNRQN